MSNPTLPTPTATVGAPTTTLQTIQTKVRRLTRSPSTAQLTDADLDQYINTFVVYDFPEQLRTFNLSTQFSFYTNPGQDVYNTDIASFSGAVNNPLFNFQNLYLTVQPPVYIAGYNSLFSQSREQFFNIYPRINSIVLTAGQGNGTSGPFTGVINSQQSILFPGITQRVSLLQSNVVFSAIGTPGTGELLGMVMTDVPLVDGGTGFKLNIGNLYDPNSAAYNAALTIPPTVIDPNNNINYLTGAYVVNFPMNTVAGTQINSQTVPCIQSLPQGLLFHNNEFTVRPIPDQAYRINFEVFQRPTALLSTSQSPELEEYWQYIAYGASKKIFEDRMDLESVQMIMPEFKMQERLCLRRTIVQNTTQRTATIYEQQTGLNGRNENNGWGGFGGSF